MSKKINIKIFGHKNDVIPGSCGWGPSTSCGPSEDPTSIEMYEELKVFLEDTDVREKIELSFIDLNEDDLSHYQNIKQFIEKGYQLPLTFIDGKLAFTGQVDNMKAYLILSRI